MRYSIDGNLCTGGHGRCYSLAPGVFEADDDGFNAERGSEGEVEPGGKTPLCWAPRAAQNRQSGLFE